MIILFVIAAIILKKQKKTESAKENLEKQVAHLKNAVVGLETAPKTHAASKDWTTPMTEMGTLIQQVSQKQNQMSTNIATALNAQRDEMMRLHEQMTLQYNAITMTHTPQSQPTRATASSSSSSQLPPQRHTHSPSVSTTSVPTFSLPTPRTTFSPSSSTSHPPSHAHQIHQSGHVSALPETFDPQRTHQHHHHEQEYLHAQLSKDGPSVPIAPAMSKNTPVVTEPRVEPLHDDDDDPSSMAHEMGHYTRSGDRRVPTDTQSHPSEVAFSNEPISRPTPKQSSHTPSFSTHTTSLGPKVDDPIPPILQSPPASTHHDHLNNFDAIDEMLDDAALQEYFTNMGIGDEIYAPITRDDTFAPHESYMAQMHDMPGHNAAIFSFTAPYRVVSPAQHSTMRIQELDDDDDVNEETSAHVQKVNNTRVGNDTVSKEHKTSPITSSSANMQDDANPTGIQSHVADTESINADEKYRQDFQMRAQLQPTTPTLSPTLPSAPNNPYASYPPTAFKEVTSNEVYMRLASNSKTK